MYDMQKVLSLHNYINIIFFMVDWIILEESNIWSQSQAYILLSACGKSFQYHMWQSTAISYGDISGSARWVCRYYYL